MSSSNIDKPRYRSAIGPRSSSTSTRLRISAPFMASLVPPPPPNILSSQSSSALVASSNTASLVRTTRERERRELVDLNDRFANYVERVRFLEAQNKKLRLESDGFRKQLGDGEKSRLKEMYETELKEARALVDQTAKQKSDLEVQMRKLEDEAVDLRDRLESLQLVRSGERKNLDNLSRQVADNEAELGLLHRRIKDTEEEYKRQKSEAQKLSLQIQNIMNELYQETSLKLQFQNEKQSLEEEINFLKQIHLQELEDTRSAGLGSESSLDPSLFFKHELANAIRDIRDEYESLNQQQRQEIENWYRLKVQELQSRRPAESPMGRLRDEEELRQLRDQVTSSRRDAGQLRSKNQDLEGRISELERVVDQERRQGNRAIGERDREIVDLRTKFDQILSEYDDLVSSKTTLDSEISVYRKLLEGEEHRSRSLHPIPEDSHHTAYFSEESTEGAFESVVEATTEEKPKAPIATDEIAQTAILLDNNNNDTEGELTKSCRHTNLDGESRVPEGEQRGERGTSEKIERRASGDAREVGTQFDGDREAQRSPQEGGKSKGASEERNGDRGLVPNDDDEDAEIERESFRRENANIEDVNCDSGSLVRSENGGIVTGMSEESFEVVRREKAKIEDDISDRLSIVRSENTGIEPGMSEESFEVDRREKAKIEDDISDRLSTVSSGYTGIDRTPSYESFQLNGSAKSDISDRLSVVSSGYTRIDRTPSYESFRLNGSAKSDISDRLSVLSSGYTGIDSLKETFQNSVNIEIEDEISDLISAERSGDDESAPETKDQSFEQDISVNSVIEDENSDPVSVERSTDDEIVPETKDQSFDEDISEDADIGNENDDRGLLPGKDVEIEREMSEESTKEHDDVKDCIGDGGLAPKRDEDAEIGRESFEGSEMVSPRCSENLEEVDDNIGGSIADENYVVDHENTRVRELIEEESGGSDSSSKSIDGSGISCCGSVKRVDGASIDGTEGIGSSVGGEAGEHRSMNDAQCDGYFDTVGTCAVTDLNGELNLTQSTVYFDARQTESDSFEKELDDLGHKEDACDFEVEAAAGYDEDKTTTVKSETTCVSIGEHPQVTVKRTLTRIESDHPDIVRAIGENESRHGIACLGHSSDTEEDEHDRDGVPLHTRTAFKRNAKGPVSLSECSSNGQYVVIANGSFKKTKDLRNWYITQKSPLAHTGELKYVFRKPTPLEPNRKVKLFSEKVDLAETAHSKQDIVCEGIESWFVGDEVVTKLYDAEDQEKASYIQTRSNH